MKIRSCAPVDRKKGWRKTGGRETNGQRNKEKGRERESESDVKGN